MSGTVLGDDGQLRCPWGDAPTIYRAYHDTEWGREVRGEQALFERISLEAFQSGLSWITILRKRPAFRRAFAGFDVDDVAGFDVDDVTRLMSDETIVRNRAKIRATISNARAVRALDVDLSDLLWSFAPTEHVPAPAALSDVRTVTVESGALARALKRRGFRFIGPTTAYALMQATGMVDDHLADCHARRRR
ncbi:MAG: DNA-3-methyladenine glycosylase I [Nocardioidaceae bacterium]|nr:DNA-3-methyladenine glycosylase I [Nocardioidaceae bacterium]